MKIALGLASFVVFYYLFYIETVRDKTISQLSAWYGYKSTKINVSCKKMIDTSVLKTDVYICHDHWGINFLLSGILDVFMNLKNNTVCLV